MTRVLLIDADVIAYQASSACEVATEWEPGYWTWHCEEGLVKDAVKSEIDKLMSDLNGDSYKLCLTDSEGNFRKSILPTYKGNRASVKKPLVLKVIKQWMIDELGAYFRPHLEGDDCMGILATMKSRDERVIVSIDKDMKSIPGLFSRDGKTIVEITEEEADYWHLYQTLTGDVTDGYSGCPGIGPKKAEAILQGGSEDSNSYIAGAPLWDRVIKTYQKAGLGEEEALVQARVARILRASDYDFKKKEPILWTPPK